MLWEMGHAEVIRNGHKDARHGLDFSFSLVARVSDVARTIIPRYILNISIIFVRKFPGYQTIPFGSCKT